jgi:hypothetical protein
LSQWHGLATCEDHGQNGRTARGQRWMSGYVLWGAFSIKMRRAPQIVDVPNSSLLVGTAIYIKSLSMTPDIDAGIPVTVASYAESFPGVPNIVSEDRAVGSMAAKETKDLMVVGLPSHIVTRQSTHVFAVVDRYVREALRFIHACASRE